MVEISIVTESGECIEKIKLKHDPQRFVMYRGRLLERMTWWEGDRRYIERSYLELY